jgi:hypothetical protein
MSIDPKAVAARVIELGETDDFLGILNLAAPSEDARLNSKSSPQQFRKYYLKLSLIIHPDRLGKEFSDATKAFQILVRAFEHLTAPELIEEVEAPKGAGKRSSATAKKSTAISRSNDGCYRTRVCCPRCKQPWNEGSLDGNPDYCYNFLMTGLKQFTCSTCLCEFGCMTAIHRCPHCNAQFEYLPSDYHTKVTCPNSRCKKEFGFYMYHASDRAIKEVKAAVKAEQERFQKARVAKLRRAKRAGGDELDKSTQEKAFLMGLTDVCPRCGEDFTELADENEQRKHLMECVDEGKHKAFDAKKSKQKTKEAAREEKQEAQRAAQTQAAWQLLGAHNTQLWLLDEGQLREQAGQLHLDTSGDKDTLIDRIVSHSDHSAGPDEKKRGAKKTAHIEDATDEHAASGSRKRKADNADATDQALVVASPGNKRKNRKSGSEKGAAQEDRVVARENSAGTSAAEDLPSDLQSYSAAQLRSMCAAQGLLGLLPKKAVKSDMVRLLETKVFEIDDD